MCCKQLGEYQCSKSVVIHVYYFYTTNTNQSINLNKAYHTFTKSTLSHIGYRLSCLQLHNWMSLFQENSSQTAAQKTELVLPQLKKQKSQQK